jgi:hypothetical protein
VTAALGEGGGLAPFFRPPGLRRSPAVEDYLASLGIQVWSADFPADDWRHIPASRVYDLAMKRLEAKGKGILLLHDIQARTVAALPRILLEMKARGYHIVHVVPATQQQPNTPTEPLQWQLHPPSETVAISHWPKIPNFVYADAGTLPAPSPDSGFHDGRLVSLAEPFDRSNRRAHGVPLPQQAPWPRQSPPPLGNAAIVLPVPAQDIFEIQEKPGAAAQTIALSSRHAEQIVPRALDSRASLISVDAGALRRAIPGGPYSGRARRGRVSQIAAQRTRLAAGAGRGVLRH